MSQERQWVELDPTNGADTPGPQPGGAEAAPDRPNGKEAGAAETDGQVPPGTSA